jgi:hypothetical protein
MKRAVAVLPVALVAALAAATARADDAAAATPAPAPAVPAPTTTTPAADPLAEPRQLVETAANTVANLKRAIGLYEAALVDTTLPVRARSDGWADVSRAYLRWGDLEKSDAVKLGLYEKGQAAGKKGEALEAAHADAIFWATANMACVGRTRGVMNSLFMLGDLRKNLNRVLALNPNHHLARNTLGEIDHAVPGLVGGSDERAEQGYLEVLRRDPHFTHAMLLLGRLKKDRGDEAAARSWAQKVLDEKAPSLPNDWKKLDVPDARALLASLP